MRISDWSSDVCSSDLLGQRIGSAEWLRGVLTCGALCASALYLSPGFAPIPGLSEPALTDRQFDEVRAQMITPRALGGRSEEHTSELQSLMRISYAVFCLKKKKRQKILRVNDTTIRL